MHAGGIVPDERNFTLQVGEGVLTRRGVGSVGGDEAVRDANAGRPPPGNAQGPLLVTWNQDIFELMNDQSRVARSAVRNIQKNGRRIGHSRRRRVGQLVL